MPRWILVQFAACVYPTVLGDSLLACASMLMMVFCSFGQPAPGHRGSTALEASGGGRPRDQVMF